MVLRKARGGEGTDLDRDSAGDVRLIYLQIWYNSICLPHKAPQEMKSWK